MYQTNTFYIYIFFQLLMRDLIPIKLLLILIFLSKRCNIIAHCVAKNDKILLRWDNFFKGILMSFKLYSILFKYFNKVLPILKAPFIDLTVFPGLYHLSFAAHQNKHGSRGGVKRGQRGTSERWLKNRNRNAKRDFSRSRRLRR